MRTIPSCEGYLSYLLSLFINILMKYRSFDTTPISRVALVAVNLIPDQVRELADEEMLQDVDVLFQCVSSLNLYILLLPTKQYRRLFC
jgi:hypothetical protein